MFVCSSYYIISVDAVLVREMVGLSIKFSFCFYYNLYILTILSVSHYCKAFVVSSPSSTFVVVVYVYIIIYDKFSSIINSISTTTLDFISPIYCLWFNVHLFGHFVLSSSHLLRETTNTKPSQPFIQIKPIKCPRSD